TDAASANHQTVRGCDWEYRESSGRNDAGVSQMVGNSPGLAHYKRKYATTYDFQPDVTVGGRTAALGYGDFRDSCSTIVESGNAVVITTATIFTDPPPIAQLCEKAIEFTRATIDQMPP
ncbi:MAG: DUF3558 family protein, partial [Gordonia sp. (in: high G+C Gram-positive bacteria)]